MARDTQARNIGIAWDADPDINADGAIGEYIIFTDTTDDPDFLAKVDNGEWPETARTMELEWLFPELHPVDMDHAVMSTDNDGRFSSPHSPAVFQDIPLGRAPLQGPSGGRLLLSD